MELTRFQKLMLAVLAGMLVFFGVLMAVFRVRSGVLFQESLLKITEEEENAMTYAEAAKHIGPWFDDSRFTAQAHQALRLLSEPVYEAYQAFLKWKEEQGK